MYQQLDPQSEEQKTNLHARQSRSRSFKRKFTLSWSLSNINFTTVIQIPDSEYILFWPVSAALGVWYEQQSLISHFFTCIFVCSLPFFMDSYLMMLSCILELFKESIFHNTSNMPRMINDEDDIWEECRLWYLLRSALLHWSSLLPSHSAGLCWTDALFSLSAILKDCILYSIQFSLSAVLMNRLCFV